MLSLCCTKHTATCYASTQYCYNQCEGHLTGLRCREQALLKAVTDNEMVSMMVGNVKLSMPGLNKTMNKGKKAKKK